VTGTNRAGVGFLLEQVDLSDPVPALDLALARQRQIKLSSAGLAEADGREPGHDADEGSRSKAVGIGGKAVNRFDLVFANTVRAHPRYKVA
jgi:hypothetical protein